MNLMTVLHIFSKAKKCEKASDKGDERIRLQNQVQWLIKALWTSLLIDLSMSPPRRLLPTHRLKGLIKKRHFVESLLQQNVKREREKERERIHSQDCQRQTYCISKQGTLISSLLAQKLCSHSWSPFLYPLTLFPYMSVHWTFRSCLMATIFSSLVELLL